MEQKKFYVLFNWSFIQLHVVENFVAVPQFQERLIRENTEKMN